MASETETKVIDLANWIIDLTGNETKIVYWPRRDWDQVVKRKASIEKARRILDYSPKTDIKSGLKETYEWILENRDNIETS